MSFFALLDLINKGSSQQWKPGKISESPFAKEVTRIHNEYRKIHQAYSLRLIEELCAHAQSWADTLIAAPELSHSGFRYKGTRIAENISMKWSCDDPGYTAQEICEQWYHESGAFEFGREPNSMAAGHFTNMVWYNSVEIGVGKAQSSDDRCVVVTCYFPPGNVIGEFAENILPPVTDTAALRGKSMRED